MENRWSIQRALLFIVPALCLSICPIESLKAHASTYQADDEATQENTARIAHQHYRSKETNYSRSSEDRNRLRRNRHYLAANSVHRKHHYHHPYQRSFIRGVIQCVAYANAQSNVVIHANARDWWSRARGVYARGREPEPGSVLNFRSIKRMPLGHVAVVRDILDNRTITVDHSHWGQPGPRYNVPVIDVSPQNDWSSVRVALTHSPGQYGSVYPTYGFIYPRPSYKSHTSHRWVSRRGHHIEPTQLAEENPF